MSIQPTLVLNCIFLLAATAAAADPPAPARYAPAGAWPSHMTIGQVTFAAIRYETEDQTRPLFGKVNLNRYGVLPVLLLIENKGQSNLLVDRMQVRFMAPGGVDLEPLSPTDLPYLIAPKRPGGVERYPMPVPLPKKKNPLARAELESLSWGARTILPGETAQGFFYFQTSWLRKSYIYITGIRDAATLKELFFAEVPMDSPSDAPAPAAVN
jgi:hypothetical protein